jgi:hypothetical protein
VAGIGFLDGIHGQCANRIGHVIMQLGVDRHCGGLLTGLWRAGAQFEEAPDIALGQVESNPDRLTAAKVDGGRDNTDNRQIKAA